jgi:hypothetical protein
MAVNGKLHGLLGTGYGLTSGFLKSRHPLFKRLSADAVGAPMNKAATASAVLPSSFTHDCITSSILIIFKFNLVRLLFPYFEFSVRMNPVRNICL